MNKYAVLQLLNKKGVKREKKGHWSKGRINWNCGGVQKEDLDADKILMIEGDKMGQDDSFCLYLLIIIQMSSIRSSVVKSQISLKDIPVSPRNLRMIDNLPCNPIKIIDNQLTKESMVHFGKLQPHKLTNLLSDEQTHQNKLYHLASVTKQKINIYPQAQKIFLNADKTPIAFITVYGRHQAGKSLFCDKILNLAEIQNSYNTDGDLKFYGIPFLKGNTKIYLLECKGFQQKQLTAEEQYRLDLIMALSSTIILLPDPEDSECSVLQDAIDQFLKSKKRLLSSFERRMEFFSNIFISNPKKQLWPQNFYCLCRGEEPYNFEEIGELFYQTNTYYLGDAKAENCSIENELIQQPLMSDHFNTFFLRNVSTIFKDAYKSVKPRFFNNIKSQGRVLSHLIPALAAQIPERQIPFLQMQKLSYLSIEQVTKQIYAENSEKVYKFYVSQFLRGDFMEVQKPKPTDTIIQKFNESKELAYEYFDEECPQIDHDSILYLEEEEKLNTKIDQYQEQTLINNKKATRQFLRPKLAFLDKKKIKSVNDILIMIQQLKNTYPAYDADRYKIIAQKLKHIDSKGKLKVSDLYDDNTKIIELRDRAKLKRILLQDLLKQKRKKVQFQKNQEEFYSQLREREVRIDETIEGKKQLIKFQMEVKGNPNIEEVDNIRMTEYTRRKRNLQERLSRIRRMQRQQTEKTKAIGSNFGINELEKQLQKTRKERNVMEGNLRRMKKVMNQSQYAVKSSVI